MSESGGLPGYLEIDLAALAQNYMTLCDQAKGADVAAVVKANGYGLGAIPVVERLTSLGCKTFFVATLEEALSLRARLSNIEICVIEGLRLGHEQRYVEHKLAPVLNTVEQLQAWRPIAQSAVLHVDTGMNRLGLSAREFSELIDAGFDFSEIGCQVLMTHLACADSLDHAQNQKQLEEFNELRLKLPTIRTSIGNSAGTYLGSAYCGDMVRAGIALYGGNPFCDRLNPMQAVAKLMARVLQIRMVETDSNVGYGATYAVAPGSRLAVVGVGYADGYPRALGNRGQAFVSGQPAAIVGRISMDLTCIDVSAVAPDEVRVGDYVELFGDNIAIDDVASLCDTISYEILTGLGVRLTRSYIN